VPSPKKICILGAAESGIGAAILAKQKGFEVFVSDYGLIDEKYKQQLLDCKLKFEEGKHSEEIILESAEVIKSPGISDKAPIIKKIKERGISVISEIEFASRYTNAKMICITGSNGKTTTTMLTHHILQKAGLNVGLAGNIGKSLALQVAEQKHDYYVIELSSFQLDGMYDFKADIAVLLNITPDHLDRYDYQFQNYIDSKFRISNNQTENDCFIYCADDPVILRELEKKKLKARTFPISLTKENTQGAYIKNNEMIINADKNPFHMSIFDLALQGKHNLYNSMASAVSAKLVEIRKDTIRESLVDFENIEHRLEYVASVHGIEFINDSKATNVNSTWYALESMEKPIIWIVGGVDKGNDYSTLIELVKDKVKGIICLGIENRKIKDAFGEFYPNLVEVHSAEEAVKAAYFMGKSGDVVLLSPACASFDLFKNYEDRGRQFKTAVRAL
jgi:UDP-N-acetylmuramoylalanine--D-glutamate ligase